MENLSTPSPDRGGNYHPPGRIISCIEEQSGIAFTNIYLSWIYDDAHKGGDPAPWKTAFYAVDTVVGLLILAGAVMIYLNYRKKNKKA